MKLKRMIAFSLCTAMALPTCAFAYDTNTALTDPAEDDIIGMPSPITDCTGMAQVIKLTDTFMVLPDAPEGYEKPILQVIDCGDNKIIQAVYTSTDGKQDIYIRKGAGSEDISGNYNIFAQSGKLELSGFTQTATVTTKGANGKIQLATWTKGDYSYSVDSSTPLSTTQMTNLVETVNADDLPGADPRTWGPDANGKWFMDDVDADSTSIANPITECKDMAQAASLANFSLTLPQSIAGYPASSIQTIGLDEDKLIQVVYTTKDGSEDIYIRKGAGSEDISGNYNTFAQTSTLTVNGTSVTAKGADGKIHLATWTKNGYTYSADSSAGLSAAAMIGLISSIQ